MLSEKIERFLRLLGNYDDRHARLAAYSKGMRQKVLIAAGLLHDPDIVLLDEPSSGLDVGATLVLKQLIRALAAGGKIVLYSSHILEMVEQVCSSVVIRWSVACTLLAACLSICIALRRRGLASSTALTYEEEVDPAVQVLGVMRT